MSLKPKKGKRKGILRRREKLPPEMVLVEREKLDAIVQTQPVPQVNIQQQQPQPSTPPPTKVIVVDPATRKRKLEVEKLEEELKDPVSQDPKKWDRLQKLKREDATAEQELRELEEKGED